MTDLIKSLQQNILPTIEEFKQKVGDRHKVHFDVFTDYPARYNELSDKVGINYRCNYVVPKYAVYLDAELIVLDEDCFALLDKLRYFSNGIDFAVKNGFQR